MDRTLIDRYLADAETPRRAIAGLSPAELNAFPIPGTWSIQQIVLHWMDSDLVGADRMKRVIAEDNPPLLGYDESAFAQRLAYDQQDIERACEIFRLNRLQMASILQRLPDEAFARCGMHSERGRETLADLVQIYIDHIELHLKHLRKKRELLNKPL